MSLEARVGAFVAAGIVLIGTAIFLLGNYSLEKRYVIYVAFHDVSNLNPNSVVKLSGVDVGQVKDIRLEGDHVVVELAIKDGIAVYQDAVFTIGSTGIIGSKYLEIDQGRSSSAPIAPNALVAGTEPVDIQTAIAKALKSIQNMLDDLNGPGPNGSLVGNLRGSIANLRELSANLNDLIATIRPDAERAMSKAGSITDKLDSLLAKSNDVMAGLSTSQGTVGALLHDQKMKEDVQETVSNLKEVASTANDVLGRLNQFRVYWNYDERYEPAIRGSRGDIALQIVPRDGRYYYLGAENLGSPSNAVLRGTDYEPKNTVDALLGWKKEWYDLGLGLVRSAGGARLTLTPFYKNSIGKHFSLFAQGYDFSRNRVINGKVFDRPAYDAGLLAWINQYFGVGARVEDISETRRVEAWAHLNFEDKDIAYLFGLMTFGAAGVRGRSKSHSP